MAGPRTSILAQARLLIVLGHHLIAFPQDSRRGEKQLLKRRQTRRANRKRLLKRRKKLLQSMRKSPNRRLKLRMKSLKKKLRQSKKVQRNSNQIPKRPKPKKQQRPYQTKNRRKAQ